MLATSGVTPLLMNLERRITKSRAVDGSNDSALWKIGMAMCKFVNTDHADLKLVTVEVASFYTCKEGLQFTIHFMMHNN